jgi:peptidoglycan/xylan/chitin deacetylase (PgdA/CDA1 family)
MHIPALVYHQVLSEGMSVRQRRPGEGIVSGQIHLAQFQQQMDLLVEEGFTTIVARELQSWLAGEAELPERPIVIDFDDHSLISFKTALPAMRERGQRATMFVISGVADGDPWLDGNPLADTEAWSVARMRWPQLKQLVDAGWDIAAHTRTHWFLTDLIEEPDGEQRVTRELVRCKEDIEANLGITPTHFGYPNTLWNERIEELVKQVYRTARHGQYYGKAEYVTRETNPYRLPTMNVSYLLPLEDFRRLVTRSEPDYEFYPECSKMWNSG